ncbi:MerR family transcriptional regulator [Paractinoplanes lichenicola]|uniref:MerR family transcriptional regulator n=1 Tax=Paractinoplanes lichenicola TaxID=2802976 RepID=A0ABS1W071_9ACTN|nr:MerR family transcriptional regulator [Actinoplanes lichenicola]MBL7260097.1 MerR family transcriptional regulator [Actinoplanes lichenicola]
MSNRVAQEGADMAWSTRELADLAGTTVNTIRHYHRLGLLEEPQRQHNGYKQYGVHDLISLLRVRRLAELGVPLSQIRAAGEQGEVGPEVLRRLDVSLAAELDRLRRVRSDIAVILRDGAAADAPAGFESLAPRLSASDNSLLHVVSQLCDDDARNDLRQMVEAGADPVNEEFDALAPDAGEATRRELADRLAPTLARHLAAYPWLSDPAGRLVKSESVTRQTFVDAVVELYNAAQLDVLVRAGKLARQQLGALSVAAERVA